MYVCMLSSVLECVSLTDSDLPQHCGNKACPIQQQFFKDTLYNHGGLVEIKVGPQSAVETLES